jgi:hypothetical protein
MDFFKTEDGILHAGRIAGLFYVAALLLGCIVLDEPDRQCLMRSLFTAGWWLALCEKQVPRSFRALATYPRRVMGTVLLVLGLAGQFYLTWSRHPHL